ncbi:DUF4347 domain-containing protein [Scytonema sp. UIC 10036]|uniref:DUF4347 domain-containing protein n=1 Tax=Scytonema sp. UIC 10036 TaxID=2304196 RepID=UPI0012DA1B4C|nr:DUF4347 domain-containing protein [Scytonema sp. UIC 10036]MUG95857.1 DUF4347 domain-containing protein [Scytonema sp. UIC 10036]
MKITNILFVDPSVNHYEVLLRSVLARIKTIVLDRDRDGVAQITQVLSQHSEVENVHIVSHGSSGTLYLGNSELSLSTLKLYAPQLKNWFSPDSAVPFSQSPSLYLYGCHVAAGDAGTEFITKLHLLTGANVAATANLTGNAVLGGDWNLEVSIGSISNQQLAFTPEVMAAYPSVLVAPTLNNTANVILNSINNNVAQPVGGLVGTPIFNLVELGRNVIDPDSGTTGIAITNANTTSGNLFYTIDNGTTWTPLGSVSDNNALLLASNASTRIYLQPNPNSSGIIDNLFTFRAWDLTSGTNGGTADTTTNGDATAFSREIDVAAIVVNAVNNAPILSNTNVTLVPVNEDEDPSQSREPVGTLVSNLVSLGINVTDPDNNAVTGIAVTDTDITNGTWFYSIDNGNSWENIGLVSNTDARMLAADGGTRIYFRPNPNFNGSVNPALTFRAWDQTNTPIDQSINGRIANTTISGNPTAFSSTTANAVITVNAVNDAPTLTPAQFTFSAINNNIGVPIGAVGTPVSSLVRLNENVTDPDANAVTGIAIVNADNTNGRWFYSSDNGSNWIPLGLVSDNNARLLAANASNRLYFLPNAGFNGTIDNVLTFRAWDQTNGTNGGSANITEPNVDITTSAFSSDFNTATITVNAGNTAPVLSDTTLSLSIDENPSPPKEAVGTLVSSLVAIGSNVTDPDLNAVTGVAIAGANTVNGNWFYSTNNGNTWIPLGAVSNTNVRLLAADGITRLYFQSNPNFNGVINDALTIHAWDQSSGTNGETAIANITGGTTAFSSTTDTIAIAVNGVNDAPILLDTNVTLGAVSQNVGSPVGAVGTLVSSLVTLGVNGNVTDSDSSVTGIAITGANTTNGSFFYSIDNGTNWTPLGVVSETNARLIAADSNTRLYFQPNANFTGTIDSALTFRAWDQSTGTNGGTANTTINGSRTAFSSATDTAAITVNGINNAPILSDLSVTLTSVNQNAGTPTGAVGTLVASLVSLGGNVTDPDKDGLTGIAITDVDTLNGSVFYSVDNGSNWVPLGSVSNTNARLLAADSNTRIYFRPNTNFTGSINNVLTFRAWDRTSSANGNVADTTVNGGITSFSSTTDTAAITVNSSVNIPDDTSNNIPDVINNNTVTLRLLSNNIFQIEGSSGSDKPKLEVTFAGRNSPSVNELGVFLVDDEQGRINGIAPGESNYAQAALSRASVIFSAIAKVPNGFNTDLTRLLEFNSGSRLQFFLVKNGSIDAVQTGLTPQSDILFFNPLNQKVVDSGNGEFTLSLNSASNSSASSYQDLEVKIKATNQPLPLGTGIQGNPFGEIIDLRNVSTQVKADFVVNREALFDNMIGFYRIADVNGGIDTDGNGTIDFRPGDAGYTEAAVRGRVAGINLTTSNQGTATFTGNLSPGSLFAPFIIVNGTPEAVLDNNSSNDPAVYFAFLGANSDKADHIRLLGNNTFGFEDLPNNGDSDYNDMIVRANLSIA